MKTFSKFTDRQKISFYTEKIRFYEEAIISFERSIAFMKKRIAEMELKSADLIYEPTVQDWSERVSAQISSRKGSR